MWLPNRKHETIARAFDKLEVLFGSHLMKVIFKSITFDNGTEFADVGSIQKSICAGELRIGNIYFAHPYCSSERGSNEVVHRFIRRAYPKGISLENVDTVQYEKYIEWVNSYPRKIHGGKSAYYAFWNEVKAC